MKLVTERINSMHILTDTNILFSALLFPNSKPAMALLHVVTHHTLVLCDINTFELMDIVNRKIPNRLSDAKAFLQELNYELITANFNTECKIRDKKDQPILNAAITNNVDIIITGDKDFLSLELDKPKCLTAAEYLNLNL